MRRESNHRLRFISLAVFVLWCLPSFGQRQKTHPPFGYDSIIYHYGLAQSQLGRINVWPLHAMGLDGSGIRLGILDAGFRWQTSSSLKTRHVVSEYDYVFHDSITANEAEDDPNQDGHGTGTFSTVAGYASDSLIGPAFNATIYLAKTEDIRSEHHIEELNYAQALQDMQARGVDITTCSLGYFTFDTPDTSYLVSDLNGHTAISTQAAAQAAKHGVLMVSAMGNSGKDPIHPYVNCPGDADSIISVGALDLDNTVVAFSSRGPTSDGRIKPDICSPGVGVWVQSIPNDTNTREYGPANGTSFATPLVAGACCLIKQAHPESSAQDIRRAVMKTGDNASTPDTARGWGLINAYAAALELGPILFQKDAWADTAAHLCFGFAAKRGIANAILYYHTHSDFTERTVSIPRITDSLIYGLSLPLAANDTLFYQAVIRDGANTTRRLPPNSYGVLAAPHVLSVQVYPQPSRDRIHATLSAGDHWSLLDAAGRELRAGNISHDHLAIDIPADQLPSGMYFLQIHSAEQGSFVRPVIVMH